MPTLAVVSFNIVCATLGGFIIAFGLVSYLLKETFYLSEAREYHLACLHLTSNGWSSGLAHSGHNIFATCNESDTTARVCAWRSRSPRHHHVVLQPSCSRCPARHRWRAVAIALSQARMEVSSMALRSRNGRNVDLHIAPRMGNGA